jgi:hypothetical protein
VPSNQSVASARIELTPQAVIAGKVEDEEGFPIQASVTLLQYQFVMGRRQLQPVGAMTTTNDLGEFRLAGLVAGSYYLRVSRQNFWSAWDERYGDEYYPGVVTVAEATQLEAQAGKELSGIHMKLKRREGYRIAGRLVLPADVKPSQSLALVLSIADGTSSLPRAYTQARPDMDWCFTFRHIPPGDYDLSLQPATGTIEPGMLHGQTKLTVAQGDLNGVALRCETAQGADIQGKVIFAGGATPRAMVVTLLRRGSPLTARTNDDGTFVVKDVMPGHYDPRIADVSEPAEGHRAQLMFCRFGGQPLMGRGFDVNGPTDGVLEINVAESNAELSLRALADTPEASSGAYIYVRGIRSQRFFTLPPSNEAVRRIFLLPGAYRVFAVHDRLNRPLVDDVPFLEAHRKDIAVVNVQAGHNPTVELRVISR